MKSNNVMIPKLYTLLAEELEKREYLVPQRVLSDGDRQRQGLALTKARYFISVLENHIMNRTGSVVFTIEIAQDCYTLRFYRPLRLTEYNRLAASDYAPVLRSKVYLNVGLGQRSAASYAYSEVKLSQYGSVIDLFDGLFVLGRELEALLKVLDNRQDKRD